MSDDDITTRRDDGLVDDYAVSDGEGEGEADVLEYSSGSEEDASDDDDDDDDEVAQPAGAPKRKAASDMTEEQVAKKSKMFQELKVPAATSPTRECLTGCTPCRTSKKGTGRSRSSRTWRTWTRRLRQRTCGRRC